jgi:hypothetical protein
MTCRRCRLGEAVVRRRLVTNAATIGLPEPVCLACARACDEEAERWALGAISVDRAVRRRREAQRTHGVLEMSA